MTIKNFEVLIKKFDDELIRNKLARMENWKNLLKQNESVYLTLDDWCSNEIKQRTP